jgi:hypothetical protein
VGPAGLGKTQFCLTLCIVACLDRVAAEGKVLYLDTERKFSAARLQQIAAARFPGHFDSPAAMATLLDRVLVQSPASSEDLLKQLEVRRLVSITHARRRCPRFAAAGQRHARLMRLMRLMRLITVPPPPPAPCRAPSRPPSSTTRCS